MAIDKIVRGAKVLIRKGTWSTDLDCKTIFREDVSGTVETAEKDHIVVMIPGYERLRTYNLSDVQKID